MKTEFFAVMVSSVILLLIYSFLFVFLARLQKSGKKNEGLVYIQRMAGILSFGAFPLFIIALYLPTELIMYGTGFPDPQKSFLWFLILTAVIIPLSFIQGKKESNLKVYPQIRNSTWNLRIVILSAITWTAYLLGYEFFFRGFLLFACIREVGEFWAVVINIIIYSLAHIPKGKLETFGAIPLGIVLCIATISTKSIWVAFGVHVVMALSSEWISLYFNKEIKVEL